MTHQAHTSGKHSSLWAATADVPKGAALTEDVRADVCIVGAGISGLTTAYLLLKVGKSVVVLEDGAIGGGASSVTTAHLSTAVDDRYFEIERLHGADGARLVAESHTAAIQQIANIIEGECITCDFAWLDGYLLLSPETPEAVLDQERDAALRAGVSGVARMTEAPLPGWTRTPCLRFPRQAKFHPLRYLAGLVRAIESLGGRIFTGAHAEEIHGGAPGNVRVGRNSVAATHIVVATNSPVNDRVAIHTKQSGYMTYVIGVRVPRGSVPDALYWDTGDPYHYVRLQRDEERPDSTDILIVGGEDHKTGQDSDTDTRYVRLEAWAREHFQSIEEVAFRWAGQVMETVDGVAFIGRNPLDHENVFVITGDSGMGMTHGTIGGMLIRDLVTEQENPWATLYDPARKTLRAAGTDLREAANMAAPYTAWLTEGEVETADTVAPGEGAVVRYGLKTVATYRDVDGSLHETSAVCPHLGGIVHWNPAERTWDCPCHGSRFDKFGIVVHGPANKNLATASRSARHEV
jgi:glycine/D-amino acid oxidase-like deaminating enzyme/nitrite reductase/ring-hydroxylating ferredoxin subunit